MNAALTFPEVCTFVKFINLMYLLLKWVKASSGSGLVLLSLWRHEEWVTKMKKPHICWRRSGYFLYFAGKSLKSIALRNLTCSCRLQMCTSLPERRTPRSLFFLANKTFSGDSFKLLVCLEECWRSGRLLSPRRMSFAGRLAGPRRRSPSSSSACSPRPAWPKKRRVTEPTTSTLF